MLNLTKETQFKYYLRQLFEGSEMDEELVQNIIANILSKASRNSVDDALDFKDEQVKLGNIPKEISDEIDKLLMKFSFWR